MTSLRHVFFISFVFPSTRARRKWFSIRKSAFSLATLLHLSQTISSNFSFRLISDISSWNFWANCIFFFFFSLNYSKPATRWAEQKHRQKLFLFLVVESRSSAKYQHIDIFYLFYVYHDLTFSGHVLFFEIKNSSMGRRGYVAWRWKIGVFGAETLVRLQHIGRVTQIAKQRSSPGSGNESHRLSLSLFPIDLFWSGWD